MELIELAVLIIFGIPLLASLLQGCLFLFTAFLVFCVGLARGLIKG